MLRRLMCWLGRCTRCETLSNEDGIGGRCIDCGKIHGWVTRDELVAFSKRHTFKFDHVGTP